MRRFLAQLLGGLAMLIAGGTWFFSSIYVTTSYFGLTIGSARISGGLVVVPFIIGIIWIFVQPKSIGAKIVIAGGLIVIIASIISSTRFVIRNMTLFEYLLILVLIFGGAGLIIRALFSNVKK